MMPISIHAPPRGATRALRQNRYVLPDFNSRPSARGDPKEGKEMSGFVISIHAPPRGATLRRTRFWRLAKYFNSRPSARGDVLGADKNIALE